MELVKAVSSGEPWMGAWTPQAECLGSGPLHPLGGRWEAALASCALLCRQARCWPGPWFQRRSVERSAGTPGRLVLGLEERLCRSGCLGVSRQKTVRGRVPAPSRFSVVEPITTSQSCKSAAASARCTPGTVI